MRISQMLFLKILMHVTKDIKIRVLTILLPNVYEYNIISFSNIKSSETTIFMYEYPEI